jgi:hypothetical protein
MLHAVRFLCARNYDLACGDIRKGVVACPRRCIVAQQSISRPIFGDARKFYPGKRYEDWQLERDH